MAIYRIDVTQHIESSHWFEAASEEEAYYKYCAGENALLVEDYGALSTDSKVAMACRVGDGGDK